MKNTLPMTLLAQLDDIAVFQTAAFASPEYVGNANSDKGTKPKTQDNYIPSLSDLNLR